MMHSWLAASLFCQGLPWASQICEKGLYRTCLTTTLGSLLSQPIFTNWKWPYLMFSHNLYWVRFFRVKLQRGAKKLSPCLKFPPHFCQAKWPAHAQPIGPDGTCVTQLSSINFARPCILQTLVHDFVVVNK